MNKKKTSSLKTFYRLIKFISKEKWLFVLSVLLTVGIVGLTLYFPVLSGKALDIISGGSIDFNSLHEMLMAMFMVILATMMLQWIVSLINNRLTFKTLSRLRSAAFHKLWNLPVSYVESKKTGELLSVAMTDTETIAEGLLLGFSQFVQGILMILGTIGFMIAINFKMAVAVILITPLSLFVAAFVAKKTHVMFMERSKARAAQTGFTEEVISNQKLVSAYNCNEDMIAEFEVLNENLRKTDVKATFFSSITNPSTRFVNSMVYAVVCVAGAFSAMVGQVTVGSLYAMLSYATQYTKPFNEISAVVTELQNSIASAERLFAFLDEKEEENPDKLFDFESKDANVSFENVDFSYVPDKDLIKNLNLMIKPGKKIAIVGPTGCGKTTLINLLMRFYDPCNGQIFISGTDVETVSRESIRSNIGMVLQETWLKNGTIRENLLMAKEDATEEELIMAAKKSHAYGFIKRLPNKFDTVIGEGQDDLSAGEKQLLCITRLMLAIPPMLILDEATSSIDTRTEIKIQDAFATMMEGRTCFIVAHRLSTIRNADWILVMKDGNIIEQGVHDELIKHDGFYKKLYESQTASL